MRRIVDKIALQKLSIAGAFSVGLYWILVGLYWILASTCALISAGSAVSRLIGAHLSGTWDIGTQQVTSES